MTRFTPHYTLEKTAAGTEFWKWRGYKVTDPATLEDRLFAEGGLIIHRSYGQNFRVQTNLALASPNDFIWTTYTLDEGGNHSCAHVHEYADGSGHVGISAGQEADGHESSMSVSIGCDIDVMDYPVLELKIAAVMRKIWAHPHYLQNAWGKKDFKTCQKRGADWLAGYLE